jgi:hypothetical protein
MRNYSVFECAVINFSDTITDPNNPLTYYRIAMEGYQPDGFYDEDLDVVGAVAQTVANEQAQNPNVVVTDTQGVKVWALFDKNFLRFGLGWGFTVQDAVDALYVGNPQFWPPNSPQQPWGEAFTIEESPRDTWSHGH